MFRTIDDFVTAWNLEVEITETLFRQITDQALNQKSYDDGRAMNQLVWHIAASVPEILNRAGMELNELDGDAEAPTRADELRIAYSKTAEQAVKQVSGKWLDSDLESVVGMYGEQWTKGKVLTVLLLHQTHHRGQLTVLMRQAGLIVTGVYGPAKEEWSLMGLTAAK
ncbi:DinB family protein [Solitalea lacus]|uniref:DinB family protein n=1 Tax=Solitalea lacus TaxID=2911172 RepID=UPI001EDBA705|nr:DinB family protein [Solitalea lacus]UKJ07599.1 DinB family protein [Solitalea lacus]